VLANAQVDGAPMGPVETLGYYLIVFTAGHDTTRNAISGGMLALLENPDQLAKLRRNPALAARGRGDRALDDAGQLHEAHGRARRGGARPEDPRGEELMLCYASANRDEEVFDDPFAFRIERSPEPPPRVRDRRALLSRARTSRVGRRRRCSARSRAASRSSSSRASPSAPRRASSRA
jgi:cytochrome P450